MTIRYLPLAISYFLFHLPAIVFAQQVLIPIQLEDRTNLVDLLLTEIGDFGLTRKARPTVKKHLHTGIDIMRPGNEYLHNPVFPIADGVVISKRDDGPFAQLIVEHNLYGKTIWTVYEHIAGIEVGLHERVYVDKQIARFMNKTELNKYGWQFDHFHLEILKKRPVHLKNSDSHPERKFISHTLYCFTLQELLDKYYDPISFFNDHL